MTGWLTTHVLDTALGKPAHDLEIELFRIDGDRRAQLNALRTNADGRTDTPILDKDAFEFGTYELVFHAGAYLDRLEGKTAQRFLDVIPIRFGMWDASHFHVPLLLSPFGYSTYRGS